MASEDRFAIGFQYPMEVELSALTPMGTDGKPMVAQKVFLDYLHMSYLDSGAMQVVVENTRNSREQVFDIKSDFGKPLGSIHTVSDKPVYNVYTESGRRHVGTRGRVENIAVKIKNTSALPCRVTAIEQTGTVLGES
jgi:hypothetical protein